MNAKKLNICGKCSEVFPRERRERVRGFLQKKLVTVRACPKCNSLGVMPLDLIVEDQAEKGSLLWT